MRIERMAAPRSVGARAAGERGATGYDQRALRGPRTAQARHRRLFHPVSGWFRRFERRTEHLLSTHVYPRIPGLPAIYSRALERDLTLVEGTIALPGLPRDADGLRLLLITDIHTGAFVDPAALERVFARLLTSRPDLILLGGDITTARSDELPPAADAFRSLAAPRGVFAVLGNHDHYTGEPDRVHATLESFGVTVLHNRAVAIAGAGHDGGRGREGAARDAGTGRLMLAGIDDRHAGAPDLDAALDGIAAESPVILLSHNPDVLFEAAARDVRLILSGHTHGGQVRIPGLPVLVRMSRYRLDEGHYRSGDTHLVVSRGLGVTGLPVRMACPPEAILLTLRATA